MSERPILFSPAMVLANRQGRKTETRRLAWGTTVRGRKILSHWQNWKAGDIGWVREGYHVASGWDSSPPRDLPLAGRRDVAVWYAADGPPPDWAGKYRSGMFMPRAGSRDSLRVLAVRVEPLQEITLAGVKAEGLPIPDYVVTGWHQPYAELFDRINGPGSWDKNPDVVVISYERLTK